ncbi:MAG: hypothetical protein PUC98_08295 [Clostridiales bacterium]|nr:hypothetical protein [Clostridiales bacterium]
MKKLISDPRIQKCFLPLSLVCILPLWLMLIRRAEHIPAIAYVLAAAAFVLFCLDRILKPWDRERAEKMRKPKAEEASQAEEVSTAEEASPAEEESPIEEASQAEEESPDSGKRRVSERR